MKNSGTPLTQKTAFRITLVVILGFLVYSNTINVPFAFDDDVFLQSTRDKDISNIPSMFTEFTGRWASRPLLHASLALNYFMGGLNTWGYHAVNLALHLINGILLYLLVAMTGRHLGYDENNVRFAAFMSALIFVLHPVQTEAVTNIISRTMLLSATFYFLGIILFIKAATSEKRKWVYAAGLFAVALLGAASREDFITFPLMLALYDLLFVARFRAREVIGRWRLYLLVTLACGYLVYIVLNHTYASNGGYGKDIPPLHYALTQLNVHWTYLRLTLLPINQTADYDYPIAKTLLDLPTMLSFIGYLCLWAGGVLLARRRSVVAFGILWFLVILIPISFAVALFAAATGKLSLGDVIFEHRLYLPSAGLVVLGAVLLVRLSKSPSLGKAFIPSVVIIALALGAAAFTRNAVWRSNITLWSDVIAKAPNKARGYNNIGIYYKRQRLMHKALEHFERAIALEPNLAAPYVGLGLAYMEAGEFERAIPYFEQAIDIEPDYIAPHVNLGIAYREVGQIEKAIRHLELAIELDPTSAGPYLNFGIAYMEAGQMEKAIQYFERAIELEPDIAGPYINLGIAYKKTGRMDKAVECYGRAVSVEPNSPEAHYNLANAYMQQGKADEAIAHYEETILLKPNDPDAHNNLAIAYRQKGFGDKATEHFRIAEKLRRKKE